MLAGAAGGTAGASPVLTDVGADLTTGAYSFTYQGSTFSFSSTGDPYNPVAVQTSGGGEVTAFGGFLGAPLTPSSDYVNRGVVAFGPDYPVQFAAFPTSTTTPYSNSDNFFGLEAVNNGQTYYGFAYTTDTSFNGYGFETAPNTDITATTVLSAAPEPSSWALMIAGVAMIGTMLRAGRRRPAPQVA